MVITNVIGRSRQVSVLCLCVLFVLVAFAHRADAQRGGDVPPIVIPHATPDLVVGVKVPAKIMPSDQGPIEITVDNTLTAVQSTPFGNIMGGSAANGVSVDIQLTGLQALSVQGNSGLQCSIWFSGFVKCTAGAIPAGGRATITVWVKGTGSCSIYCGALYTDAWVDRANAIVERSKTNNRAVGVTDLFDCPPT